MHQVTPVYPAWPRWRTQLLDSVVGWLPRAQWLPRATPLKYMGCHLRPVAEKLVANRPNRPSLRHLGPLDLGRSNRRRGREGAPVSHPGAGPAVLKEVLGSPVHVALDVLEYHSGLM